MHTKKYEKNDPFDSKKSSIFMVQGSLNPNITFLGQKLWPLAWNKKILVLYKGKKSKNGNKKGKMKISLNKKTQKKKPFFSCSKDHSPQK